MHRRGDTRLANQLPAVDPSTAESYATAVMSPMNFLALGYIENFVTIRPPASEQVTYPPGLRFSRETDRPARALQFEWDPFDHFGLHRETTHRRPARTSFTKGARMTDRSHDSTTHLTPQRLSRRTVLGAAAIALLPGLGHAATRQASSDASALVQRFYELVDAYQYADAYDLLGQEWHTQQSEERFTRGYGNTGFVQCTTTGETAGNGGIVIVGVELISWHNDGNIVGYTGQYTVGTEAGTMKILAGDNTPMDPPSGTPPLATLADLGLAFGPWQGAAGSREGAIIATNQSSRTVALGGSPRVTLVDTEGNTLRSTPREGSPPVAIMLAPGDRAYAPLRFSNWCGDTGDPASVQAELPGNSGTIDVTYGDNGISYPPCNGAGQPATLSIKGWTSGPA